MVSWRKVFQQVWKSRPAAGPDSRFDAPTMLIRCLFIGSMRRNCAFWALFKTHCSRFSEEDARPALPKFCQSFTRIIKYLVGLSSEEVEARPDKGAGERVNFLSPRRGVMLCFACELVCVMALGEAFAGAKFFSEAGD